MNKMNELFKECSYNQTLKNNEQTYKIENNGNVYIISISNLIYKIKFEIINLSNKNQKYSSEYNLEDFYINHHYFKSFKNISELFKFNFKKLKTEEINITQKDENEFIFKLNINHNILNNKEEANFIIKKNGNRNFFSIGNKDKYKLKTTNDNNKIYIKKNKIFPNIINSIKIIIVIIFSLFILNVKLIKKSITNVFKKTIKYILFLDQYYNEYVNANDAYPIFNYYRRKGRKEAYYFVLRNSQLHKKLLNENNLKNVIVVENYIKNKKNATEIFSYFLPNSQLIVYTYKNPFLIRMIKKTNTKLKTIYLDHGCSFFKETLFSGYLKKDEEKKAIVKIKPEYDNWLKHGWKKNQLYKAGLARWERFNHLKNQSDAILIMFTWRHLKKEEYFKSMYYKKIDELLTNDNLINYLKLKQIKVFYKRHHQELSATNGYHKYYNNYIHEVNDSENFSQIIDNSSLFITDYSTLCFDFMFQNKPVLFYPLDINDPKLSKEDSYNAKYLNKKMIFGNNYNNSKDMIEKIKFYVNNDFTIEKNIKNIYESLFYLKKNIFENLEKVFDQIITE